MITVTVNVSINVNVGIGTYKGAVPLYSSPMTDEERLALARRTNTVPHDPGHDPCDINTMHAIARGERR